MKTCLCYQPLVCVRCSFIDEFANNGFKLHGLNVPCEDCLTLNLLKESCNNCAIGYLAFLRKCRCEDILKGLEIQYLSMIFREAGLIG